jgi:hypothetical protein
LWRWTTDGRWRLIVPRTAEADPRFHQVPKDSYLTPDLIATLTAAKPMLFDIRSDPVEEVDLAQQHPEVVAELRQALDAWWNPAPPATR